MRALRSAPSDIFNFGDRFRSVYKEIETNEHFVMVEPLGSGTNR